MHMYPQTNRHNAMPNQPRTTHTVTPVSLIMHAHPRTFAGPTAPSTQRYPYTQQLERLASRISPPWDTSSTPHYRHHVTSGDSILASTSKAPPGLPIRLTNALRPRKWIFHWISAHITTQTSNSQLDVRQGTPGVISAYIQNEVSRGHIGHVGPTEVAKQLNIQLDPLGAIPKKNRPDAWRLIMDLSSPQGFSVNDGIPKEDCSFHYVSVDQAVEQIRQLGPRALMAKTGIQKYSPKRPKTPGA